MYLLLYIFWWLSSQNVLSALSESFEWLKFEESKGFRNLNYLRLEISYFIVATVVMENIKNVCFA